MLRGLTHHWRMNLAIAAGAAVAAAVLTGALLVGDSVRSSLRQLSLERLGEIDYAIAAPGFFGEEAVSRLAEDPEFQADFTRAEPAIVLRGSLRHAESGARASGVGVQGIGEGFAELFPEGPELLAEAEGIFPPAVLNASLARELGAETGDDLLLSLKRWSAVPRASLLGRKETGDVVETLRLSVAGVIPDRGPGRFDLRLGQGRSKNVFVPLGELQRNLDQRQTVNALMVAAEGDAADLDDADLDDADLDDARDQARALTELFHSRLELEDVGLLFEEHGDFVSLESRQFVFGDALVEEARELATELGGQTLEIQTYLINGFHLGERSVPYSTVTALDVSSTRPFGELRLEDGSPAPALGPREILLDAWTAEELGAAGGDEIELTYFVVGPSEELSEQSTRFTVAGVLAMEGLAVDPELSQEYPGIGDTENMAEWDPPFPLDLGLIGPADEEYWDLYRGAPKAFVAAETGRELWSTRWGTVTGLRFAPGEGAELEPFREAFAQGLPPRLPAGAFGLVFDPVKARSLRASTGATDFSGLFIGFSLFLIVSAAMLAALLFRLGVEQRSGEVGLLLAVGYPGAKVLRRLLGEGLVISALGSLVGLAGAVAYAALMMAGLRTWWRPAVGTSELHLHVLPGSLAMGWAISVVVVLLSIYLTVRKIAKVPATALLRGVVTSGAETTRAGRRSRWVAAVTLGIAAVLLVYAFASGETTNPALFFSIGPLLLIGFLALLALIFGRGVGRLEPTPGAIFRLGAGNCARHRGRSLVSTILVASATFLVVTVAAYQQDLSQEELTLDSGTGGYELMAEADVELHRSLASSEGRFELGISEETAAALEDAKVMAFRRLPGDDTSCLNLYQPTQPRVLGVPEAQRERGGFSFKQILGEVPENPWAILERELEPGVIPAVGDANSMQWILKLPLGGEIEIENDLGETVKLRLVGMLDTSIFQSELLVSEENFLRHFPEHEGWATFLIDAPRTEARDLGQLLERDLEPHGFDTVDAAEKLAAFHEVQNTYLSTFQTLGGLGLLLGTIGLAVVLLRNVIERRGELATLRAFGFRRPKLTFMVVVENGLLLAAGLAIGTVAALVTIAPHLVDEVAQVPWVSIGWTLVGIFAFGLVACTISAAGALRADLLPALKAEG